MKKDEKQKLIEQAQQIIDSGCKHIKNCEKDCLLKKAEICRAERLFDYDDGQHVAYGFLAGIAFEKGDL